MLQSGALFHRRLHLDCVVVNPLRRSQHHSQNTDHTQDQNPARTRVLMRVDSTLVVTGNKAGFQLVQLVTLSEGLATT